MTQPLTAPLTREQILALLDSNGYVTGDVVLDLADAIDGDLDAWLDQCSEALVGSICGMDIDYEVVGVHGSHSLVLRVTLDPSMVLDDGDV